MRYGNVCPKYPGSYKRSAMNVKHGFLIYWNAFRNSFKLFKNHDTLTLGAALSYYTGFSLVPILIIVISVAGALLGPEAVQGEIKRQLLHIMGAEPAQQLENIIKAAYRPGHNIFGFAYHRLYECFHTTQNLTQHYMVCERQIQRADIEIFY